MHYNQLWEPRSNPSSLDERMRDHCVTLPARYARSVKSAFVSGNYSLFFSVVPTRASRGDDGFSSRSLNCNSPPNFALRQKPFSGVEATDQIIQHVFMAAILPEYCLVVYFVRVASACDSPSSLTIWFQRPGRVSVSYNSAYPYPSWHK
jgi:hypothetical protein